MFGVHANPTGLKEVLKDVRTGPGRFTFSYYSLLTRWIQIDATWK